jgi:hypothetical protein
MAEPSDMLATKRNWKIISVCAMAGGCAISLAAMVWLCASSLLSAWASAAAAPAAAAPASGSQTILFNRDIRPILSENCFACHGPDHNKRKADLRLDIQTGGAFVEHKGHLPIVAGNTAKSELYRRLVTDDSDDVMPPKTSQKHVTPKQIDLIKRWIEHGAAWQPQWAFIPPQRPPLPQVKNVAWCRNPIDRFILARLEAESLKPSPEADKPRLIRRLYLDLIGLPPTIQQVDAFVNDPSKDAYEKVIDELLSNPHYGERMALDWLDAARYADTHGYHIDSGRDMTRWREWVIDSFNHDLPYDQFTIQQLAGDLVPNATDDTRIASGFCRNNMVNFEGGAIPEEYHTAYIIDRTNTMSTIWLGMTMGCCQCHDHKFDPVTQKEYYQLYSFFNNVPENGLDGQKGNAVPYIRTPTSEQKRKLDDLAAKIKRAEEELAAPSSEADAEQAEWEKQAIPAEAKLDWTSLQPSKLKSTSGAALTADADKSILVAGTNPENDTYTITAAISLAKPTAIRVEAMPEDHLNGKGPGRSSNGNFVLTDVRVRFTAAAGGTMKPVKLKGASADFSQDKFPVTGLLSAKGKKSGWAIYPEVGKPHEAIFQFDRPLAGARGVLEITLEFKSRFGQHQMGHFRLSTTNAKDPLGSQGLPKNIHQILALGSDRRSEAQRAELRTYFRAQVSETLKPLAKQLAALRTDEQEAEAGVRTTMVMAEMATPRPTFVLMRGQYDKPGDKVEPGVPASLPPMPAGAPRNRLGLAEWLVAPNHPLTARVAVNRYWQTFFGTGIVKTAEDFGSQGEEPSHPELLDWLACEFMNPTNPTIPKWDTKAIIRLIVTSATYRQSSAVTPELFARDPENRLLARGARFRLPAEFVRDQALAISSLLNDEIGGRSVEPYQPQGLWSELMSRADGAKWTAQVYKQDHGKDLYRRTMYTFWKRTCPPPSLSTFDAPDREVCTVRRSRTNTPLQALVLMNDPTYVEASRKLAERMMTEGGNTDESKIVFAFKLATARVPSRTEIAVLKRIHEQQIAVFQKDTEAAQKLLKVGESPENESLNVSELAAWTSVASVVLNLDETITKG